MFLSRFGVRMIIKEAKAISTEKNVSHILVYFFKATDLTHSGM
jgi:hypothetical protein